MPAINRRKRGKLTRKEIKEDKLVTITTKVLEWLRENYRPVLIGVGAVVVVAASVLSFFAYRSYTYGRASELLGEAIQFYRVDDGVAQDEDIATKVARYTQATESLQSLIDSYPGSPSMREALFYLGESYLNLGNYNKAIESYDRLATNYPQDKLAPLALNSLAYAYEQLSDHSKAIEIYGSFLQEYPDHFLSKRAHLNIGRLWETGNNYEEAQKSYQLVVSIYPNTLTASQAQGRLDWLAATAKIMVGGKSEGEK